MGLQRTSLEPAERNSTRRGGASAVREWRRGARPRRASDASVRAERPARCSEHRRQSTSHTTTRPPGRSAWCTRPAPPSRSATYFEHLHASSAASRRRRPADRARHDRFARLVGRQPGRRRSRLPTMPGTASSASSCRRRGAAHELALPPTCASRSARGPWAGEGHPRRLRRGRYLPMLGRVGSSTSPRRTPSAEVTRRIRT